MRPRGFTLLELLVAMAVFALIGVGAYTSLFAVLDAREITHARSERLADVQYAIETFADDLRQTVDRPVRGLQPRQRAALYAPGTTGETLVALTRGGWPNPAELERSTLARIEWRQVEDELERRIGSRLDAPATAEPIRRRVLDRVEAVRLRFRGEQGEWAERWPPLNATGEVPLPRAIELTVELADWGEIRRLVALPPGPRRSGPTSRGAAGEL